MAAEITEAKNWIYDALYADLTLRAIIADRIYQDVAPQGSALPRIIYNYMGGGDVNALGTARLMTTPLFQIRIVTQGFPSAAAKTADGLMDAVLQNMRVTTSGQYVISAQRETPVDRVEYDANNTRFSNIGGLYRLYISKL